MSKTPEQVAQDACSICWINMPGSVDWPAQCASIVSALRSAGWLRSSPWVESASEERIATEKRYLKRKWKAHIRMKSYKSRDRVSMDAPRRQSVKL